MLTPLQREGHKGKWPDRRKVIRRHVVGICYELRRYFEFNNFFF